MKKNYKIRYLFNSLNFLFASKCIILFSYNEFAAENQYGAGKRKFERCFKFMKGVYLFGKLIKNFLAAPENHNSKLYIMLFFFCFRLTKYTSETAVELSFS